MKLFYWQMQKQEWFVMIMSTKKVVPVAGEF